MQPTGKSKVKFSSIFSYILIGIVFLLSHFWFSGVFRGYEMGILARNGSAFEIHMQSKSAIKCPCDFRNFQFASAMRRQKKLPKTQQKPLYITSTVSSACLGILPRAMIQFLNSGEYLSYLNYIGYLQHLTGETEDTVSLVDQSLCFGFFVWPFYNKTLLYIIKRQKNQGVFWSIL